MGQQKNRQAVENTETIQPLSPAVVQTLIDNRRKFLLFLERKVGNKATAEDILQNSLVRMIEKGSNLQEKEGAIAWFYKILKNAIIDHYRRVGVESRSMAKEMIEQLNKEAMEPEIKGAICACLHSLLPSLKPEYAQIVKMVDLEEGSLAEVAEQEGLSANNATVRLHRARKALKSQLEKSCGSCATHGCLDCSCGTTQVRR